MKADNPPLVLRALRLLRETGWAITGALVLLARGMAKAAELLLALAALLLAGCLTAGQRFWEGEA